jgi:peptidyl-prolyl cis-trans isomerase A (cyclophilin A)
MFATLIPVVIETPLGSITVELNRTAAPVTTANFLTYVDSGAYNGGNFHRTVTLENQPCDDVRIEVIQGGTGGSEPGPDSPAAIKLERTSETGVKHLDGTISMARWTADSATSDFFICINDQPELDFGGRRNPDGQGFAAFGQVADGMDVVRAIQHSPCSGVAAIPDGANVSYEAQKLTPPIAILSIRRA